MKKKKKSPVNWICFYSWLGTYRVSTIFAKFNFIFREKFTPSGGGEETVTAFESCRRHLPNDDGGGVLGQTALIVQLHVKLEPADFGQQHVPLAHHQVQLCPQLVDLLALLFDDIQALVQRDVHGVRRVMAAAAATVLLRLSAARPVDGLLQSTAAVRITHVLRGRGLPSVT